MFVQQPGAYGPPSDTAVKDVHGSELPAVPGHELARNDLTTQTTWGACICAHRITPLKEAEQARAAEAAAHQMRPELEVRATSLLSVNARCSTSGCV
jgi:hypothetical protein